MEGHFAISNGFQSFFFFKFSNFPTKIVIVLEPKSTAHDFKSSTLSGQPSLESNAVFFNPVCALVSNWHALKNTGMWSQDPRTCTF